MYSNIGLTCRETLPLKYMHFLEKRKNLCIGRYLPTGKSWSFFLNKLLILVLLEDPVADLDLENFFYRNILI